MKVRKAVIPAAGLGTRFLPASKAVPKEMLPLVDKPIIQYIVEEAVASGIEDIVIVTSQSKRALEDHFDYMFELEQRLISTGKVKERDEIRRVADMAHFIFVRQKEALGNGHAVLVAKEAIGNEPFAVLWGDDVVVSDPPCLKQLIDVYDRFHCSVLAVMPVPESEVSKYGILKAERLEERLYRVYDVVEKPSPESAPSCLAGVKGYVLTPHIFSILERTPPGQGGEIWLVDALRQLARQEPVYAWEFIGRRYDAGDKLDFLRATVDLALDRAEFRDALLEHLRKVGVR